MEEEEGINGLVLSRRAVTTTVTTTTTRIVPAGK